MPPDAAIPFILGPDLSAPVPQPRSSQHLPPGPPLAECTRPTLRLPPSLPKDPQKNAWHLPLHAAPPSPAPWVGGAYPRPWDPQFNAPNLHLRTPAASQVSLPSHLSPLIPAPPSEPTPLARPSCPDPPGPCPFRVHTPSPTRCQALPHPPLSPPPLSWPFPPQWQRPLLPRPCCPPSGPHSRVTLSGAPSAAMPTEAPASTHTGSWLWLGGCCPI